MTATAEPCRSGSSRAAFKLQLWTPDRRLPAQPLTGMLMLGRQYAAADLAKHEMWVAGRSSPSATSTLCG